MSYLVGALAGACFPWEWSGWLLGILIGCMAILVGRLRSVHRQSIWLLVGTYLTVATAPRIPRLDLEKCYAGPLWILDAQRAVDPWGGLWRVRLAWPLGSRVEGVWHMMPFRSETFPGGFSAQKVWGNQGLQGEAHWREKGEVDSLHVSGAARWRSAWHARIAGLVAAGPAVGPCPIPRGVTGLGARIEASATVFGLGKAIVCLGGGGPVFLEGTWGAPRAVD